MRFLLLTLTATLSIGLGLARNNHWRGFVLCPEP